MLGGLGYRIGSSSSVLGRLGRIYGLGYRIGSGSGVLGRLGSRIGSSSSMLGGLGSRIGRLVYRIIYKINYALKACAVIDLSTLRLSLAF